MINMNLKLRLLYICFIYQLYIDTVTAQFLPLPLSTNYTYCEVGQSNGTGYVTFDECEGAGSGDFVCPAKGTCDPSQKCGGGHSHQGCICQNCEFVLGTKVKESGFTCKCEDDCFCEKLSVQLQPQVPYQLIKNYTDCEIGQSNGTGYVTWDHCEDAGSSSFVCPVKGTCNLKGDCGLIHSHCICENCSFVIGTKVKEKGFTCRCGDDCFCEQVPISLPVPSPPKPQSILKVIYSDCEIGQWNGTGYVTFDDCVGVWGGHFVCPVKGTCDSSEKCGGGHSHEGCLCHNCTFVDTTPKATGFTCQCKDDCFCEKPSVQLQPQVPIQLTKNYTDCEIGQSNGTGYVTWDHCEEAGNGSFVCPVKGTCNLKGDCGLIHSHCICENCSFVVGTKVKEKGFTCRCGDDCFCEQAPISLPVPSPPKPQSILKMNYPDCEIGQWNGTGYVTFDECVGAGDGHFVCPIKGTCDQSEKCGGGHSHEGCLCHNCTFVDITREGTGFTCQCKDDCSCEKPSPPPQPKNYTDCEIGQRNGTGYVTFDECVGAGDGDFVCPAKGTCDPSKNCGGAHSHEGCLCQDCTFVDIITKGTGFTCECNGDCFCEQKTHLIPKTKISDIM